ncbi:Nitrite reductase [NAD(P)H] large subunit [Fimbriimonas ginsengisoli Gsoil 348]|uniref:Nitrite reductase [NAD(P)H] large subunit n=1 Tax=Fimbriimonas ginsengisoli Gsoil 348 TaxID=661478 RepID=A0A068NNN3_FIMGI|nr:Nitrite reductase [NAD(P)H] large subunit [Fimbriimonas ginsengisoli Gsoil 348]
MSPKQRLVVIGNGMAGARTVEEILARGGRDSFDITVLGEEPHGNYNRILLSKVLSGSQDPSEILLNPIDWYADNGVTLKTNSKVSSIDRAAKNVQTADGSVVPYDRLIIATGSRPMVPPFGGLRTDDGALKPGVFVFRTIEDCVDIAAYARKCKRATVIGGGLLGLECARGLLEHGVEVHVVHLGSHLMEMQLDRQAGEILKETLRTMGLHVHLGRSTKCILGDNQVEGLAFADGETLDCCMTVISCGIVPNVELAKDCGLTVKRGIVTDDQMRSVDDPDIFAVGECAEHRGRVYGLVAPLWHQGQVLADVITDTNPTALYPGSKLATKLKVMGVDLATMGITEPAPDDEVVQFNESRRGRYKKLIIRDGTLVGAILLGETEKAATLLQAFDRGSALPEDRAQLLFSLEGNKAEASVIDAPDDTQICNCNGVCKSAIVQCVKNGRKSLKSVMDATRAGTGCGSCKHQVQQLVEWAADGAVEADPTIHYYVPGVPLAKPELVAAVREQGLKSVSSVFDALAGGQEDPSSKMGLASLLKQIWGADYEDERDARYINDRVHANIQKDRTFSVIPRIYGGVTSPDQLRRIADVADKYEARLVKITGGQRIDLLGIKKEDLPDVWKDLGMPSGHAYAKAFRTCKTCVGTDFCRYGLGDSTKLGVEIETRFQGLESPGKLKLATAGCPRNCSEAYVKDVGAVAVEGGRWEIYVGGAAGAHVRKGDLLCTVDSHADVLLFVGRFLQYYRENAKYLERTYGFVERIGIAKIREVVVEDSEGIATHLDHAMQQSVDAYVDPWLEAEQPVSVHQFASQLVGVTG